ncbi:hypothetical protein K502DRAFT_323328 [Neoconidiobolus thromboides FSU 785]|nr:hypothetical protein K502DRAFT_323328 [Neoconidiobolus thromboides FSU 785]
MKFKPIITNSKLNVGIKKVITMTNDKLILLTDKFNLIEIGIKNKEIKEIQTEGDKPYLTNHLTCYYKNKQEFFIFGGSDEYFYPSYKLYKVDVRSRKINKVKSSILNKSPNFYPSNVICDDNDNKMFVFGNHNPKVYKLDMVKEHWKSQKINGFEKIHVNSIGIQYNSTNWYLIKDKFNIYIYNQQQNIIIDKSNYVFKRDNNNNNNNNNNDNNNDNDNNDNYILNNNYDYFQPVIKDNNLFFINNLNNINLFTINNESMNLNRQNYFIPLNNQFLKQNSTTEQTISPALAPIPLTDEQKDTIVTSGALLGNLIAIGLSFLILFLYLFYKLYKFHRIKTYQNIIKQQNDRNNMSSLFDLNNKERIDSFSSCDEVNFNTIESNIASLILDPPPEIRERKGENGRLLQDHDASLPLRVDILNRNDSNPEDVISPLLDRKMSIPLEIDVSFSTSNKNRKSYDLNQFSASRGNSLLNNQSINENSLLRVADENYTSL